MSIVTAEIPKQQTKNMELFKAIHRAQHCQRNFDLNQKMPEQDIKTIITAATECTSKQNIANYKLHVITDRKTIKQIYKCTGGRIGQSQVLGNLVIVFEDYFNHKFITKQFKKIDERIKEWDSGRYAFLMANDEIFAKEVKIIKPYLENSSLFTNASEDIKSRAIRAGKFLDIKEVNWHDKDKLDLWLTDMNEILNNEKNQALGIAAGSVNLTASLLGYGTGCCSCFNHQKLQKLLKLKNPPMLIMGIGFKQKGKNRRVHQNMDNQIFGTLKKQPIEINYIH